VPRGTTGPPCTWGYKYGDPALRSGGVSNLRQKNVAVSIARLGFENDCAGEDQKQLQTTDPSCRQRGCRTSTKSQLSDSKKNLAMGPRSMPGTKIDRLWSNIFFILTVTGFGF
jgi:hypothetical protein